MQKLGRSEASASRVWQIPGRPLGGVGGSGDFLLVFVVCCILFE